MSHSSIGAACRPKPPETARQMAFYRAAPRKIRFPRPTGFCRALGRDHRVRIAADGVAIDFRIAFSKSYPTFFNRSARDSRAAGQHGEIKTCVQHFDDYTASVMNNFQIRLALARDANQIATMSRDQIERGLGWKYLPSRILELMRDDDTNVVVAWHETGMAGFAIMEYQGFEAHLILFAVQPAHRRQGAGTALLHWLIKTAGVAGAQAIYVELRKSNDAARSFYESLGFKKMEALKDFYHQHEDGVRMALDLRHDGTEKA